MSIKNIIFDLGGVIIDIEPERSLKAFQRLVPHLNGMNVYGHRLFHELETGDITADDFRQQLRNELAIDLDDAAIDSCLHEMLGEIPVERIRVLEKMKQRFQTLLLSNTNSIHYDAISKYIQNKHKAPSLELFFHNAYFSHISGLRKPDIRIFELVISENNLVPGETLYLDDMEEHLKSARSLGIVTEMVTTENDILKILKDF